MVAVSPRTTSSNGLDEITLTRWTVDLSSSACARSGFFAIDGTAFVNVRGRSAVDQKTQQFRAAVMAARIHQLLALVDAGEVEIGNDDAFARA